MFILWRSAKRSMIPRVVTVTAMVFAAYKSFKVLSPGGEDRDDKKAKEWLRFWCVFLVL